MTNPSNLNSPGCNPVPHVPALDRPLGTTPQPHSHVAWPHGRMAAAGGGGAYDHTDFVKVCRHGSVEDACALLALTGEDRVDVHADDEAAWRWACRKGCTDVVKVLLDLTGDRRIDVHAEGEDAWQGACINGHTDMVELLLGLTGDRRIRNTRAWSNCFSPPEQTGFPLALPLKRERASIQKSYGPTSTGSVATTRACKGSCSSATRCW